MQSSQRFGWSQIRDNKWLRYRGQVNHGLAPSFSDANRTGPAAQADLIDSEY